MSYERLVNFKEIIKIESFDYVCDAGHIRDMGDMIDLLVSEKEGQKCREVLSVYIDRLMSFYFGLDPKDVPDLTIGFETARSVLVQAFKLFAESLEKRRLISQNKLNDLKEDFLYGLSRMYTGLKAVFDPDLVTESSITKEQLVRYFLDEKEGLRGRFAFNRMGKYAFANRLSDLNKEELAVVERLLLRPSESQIERKREGWIGFGKHQSPVRILASESLGGKKKIYFVFKVSEHRDYESQLRISPDKMSFAAA
ncbi:MAG: hypothetical protein AABX70_01160 [Nanoarchaeota archaeon]